MTGPVVVNGAGAPVVSVVAPPTAGSGERSSACAVLDARAVPVVPACPAGPGVTPAGKDDR